MDVGHGEADEKPRAFRRGTPYYSEPVSDETIARERRSRPRRRLGVEHGDLRDRDRVSRGSPDSAREIVAASFFGTTAAASAFTIASQIPNLMSNLFAQAALSAAFVPVFTELLQQGRKREAFKLASTLFWIILIALGALTVLWIAGRRRDHAAVHRQHAARRGRHALTAGLAQVLFPVVLLLGLTGLLVGILQSYDEFTIPAIAPAVWNLVILVGAGRPAPPVLRQRPIYAYAIAWLVATVVQLLMVASALRQDRLPARRSRSTGATRACARCFLLMLPVTIGIGIVNLDQLLNSVFGIARLERGAARDRQRVPDLHAAPGHLQRRGRDRAVPDAQPAGGAPRRRRDAPDDRERACARSTCC